MIDWTKNLLSVATHTLNIKTYLVVLIQNKYCKATEKKPNKFAISFFGGVGGPDSILFYLSL